MERRIKKKKRRRVNHTKMLPWRAPFLHIQVRRAVGQISD